MKKKPRIAIIGLGYVGLPLAVEFAKKFNVLGYDVNSKRVSDLNLGNDFTLEISQKQLNDVLFLKNPNKNFGLKISIIKVIYSHHFKTFFLKSNQGVSSG